MTNTSIKNILFLSAFDLRNNKKQILGWLITIFGVMFLYMILFPSVKDMVEIKMQAMPKEFLQFFGMSNFSDMGNFVSYFGMVFSLILIALAIFSATFSANLIYKEEKTKSVEFLYALSISRTEIYFSKLITAFIGVLAVTASALISTIICGFINGGKTFILADIVQIIKISGFTAFFFISTSFLLSGIVSKISTPAVSSMIVLVSYMLGYLGNLLGEKAEFLRYFSPFELFSHKRALAFESTTATALMIYFIVMILFIVAGLLSYRKRDYNI